MDTIAVGVREGDEEEEEIIDGDSLEGLRRVLVNRTQLARLLRSVCGGSRPQDRCTVSYEMPWGSKCGLHRSGGNR
jgi:hypothetical protein